MSIDQLGSRLLRALATSEAGAKPLCLLGGDAARIRLCTAEGDGVTLLGDPERARAEMAEHKGGVLHIVLVGGGPLERRRLADLWPRWQLSRQFAFHQIDDSSTYHNVKGSRLSALALAAARAPSLEPLTSEEAAPLIEATRGRFDAENQFIARRTFPWVTVGIFAACLVAFVFQEMWGGSDSTFAIMRMGANRGRAGLTAPWTLLTSAFLHFGVFHFTVNMLALFSFGPIVERALGARRYLLLYLGSALGGSILSSLGHSEAVVSAGASGALWGLMVAGGVLVIWPNGLLPPLLAARARKKVWQPVLLNGIYSLQPGIDWLCHLGGGLAGGGLMALLVWRIARAGSSSTLTTSPPTKMRRLALALAAVACVASVVGSFAVAWANERPWELGTPPPMERQFIGVMGLSLEIPRGLALTREDGGESFGTLERDPLAVEIRYAPSEKPLSPDERERGLAELGQTLAKQLPDGVTLDGQPKPADVGALHTIVIDGKYESGVSTRSWVFVLGDGSAVVRVYQHPGAPEKWRALRDSFIRSLRTTGARID